MTREEAIPEKCCLTCALHRKTCFHGATNLANFTDEECKRSGPPYYTPIHDQEEEKEDEE